MLFAIVCRPKVGKSPCVKEVSIRGDGNHGCGVSAGIVYFMAFIKMTRAGNNFMSAFIGMIARAPKNKGVCNKQ